MNKIFKHKDFNLVVYVEDTDFQGFVYHANYIKYFERARSDFLTSNNISQIELKELDSNARANHTSFAKELGIEINREKVLVEIIELLDKVIQKQVNQ